MTPPFAHPRRGHSTPAVALLRKELRAMLPAWGAAIALVLAGAVFDGPFIEPLATMGYLLGSFALGAQAFGQEYMHHTLPMLMTQPIPRWRIVLVKLAVLACGLTTLGAAAVAGVFPDLRPGQLLAPVERVLATVGLTAFLLAPVLTMLTRSPIAGALFAGSVLGIVATTGGLIGLYKFGFNAGGAIDRYQEAFFWRVMPIVWTAGGIGSWIVFQRLQAMEGAGGSIDPIAWVRRFRPAAAAAARRDPLSQLIVKELHLQQLVFVVAALYVVVGTVVAIRKYTDAAFEADLIAPVTFIYGVGLAVLIGALASAEERQLGTLESQSLLPIPSARQWAVKAAVVMVLSVVLAMLLPATIVALTEDGRRSFFTVRQAAPIFAALITFAVGSLYVSSWTTSGIRALTLAVPFLFAGTVLVTWGVQFVWMVSPWRPGRIPATFGPDASFYLLAALAAGLVWLLLRLGYENHRTSDVSFGRVAWQLPWLAGYIFAASAFLEFTGRGW